MYLATWHIADWPFSTIRTNNRSFYYNNVKQATWECEVNLKSRSYDASVIIKSSHIFLNVKLFTATLVTRTENERKDGRMSITWSSIPHSLIPTWYCKSENMVVLWNMLNGEHLEPNKKWHQNIPDVYAILILLLWTCFYSFSFFMRMVKLTKKWWCDSGLSFTWELWNHVIKHGRFVMENKIGSIDELLDEVGTILFVQSELCVIFIMIIIWV